MYFLHNVIFCFLLIISGQPKRHLLTTGWSVFVSAKRLVAGDSVLFIWYLFHFILFYFFSPLDSANCFFIFYNLLGTKRISFFWEYGEPIDRKLSCHPQFYPVIVCTLGFLQLLLMLQQLIAALQCSITQGCIYYLCICLWIWYLLEI